MTRQDGWVRPIRPPKRPRRIVRMGSGLAPAHPQRESGGQGRFRRGSRGAPKRPPQPVRKLWVGRPKPRRHLDRPAAHFALDGQAFFAETEDFPAAFLGYLPVAGAEVA